MNNGPRYNWDGMSEEIQEELDNDYLKKQTIKGIKKGLSIVLALGIGTVGTYTYLHNKVQEARKEQIEIAMKDFKPKSLSDTLQVYPSLTPLAQIEPTATAIPEYQSELDLLSNKISKNKQIKTAIQGFQQENLNNVLDNYDDLEQLMDTTNFEEKRILAEKGFLYFINMERKLLAAYVGDSVQSMYLDAEYIKATYERRGRQYDFHIRYTNSQKPITIARPTLERNSSGQLEYAKGTTSNLPIELYERLIFIGEYNKFKNSKGTRNRFRKIC